MENSGIIWVIVLFVLFALFFGKSKKTKKRKHRASRSSATTISVGEAQMYKGSGRVDPGIKKLRRYIAETVPVLLDDYNVLLPSFYSRFSAEYLRTGHISKINKEDVVEGVSFNEASWTLSHCMQLASARQSAIDKIENAEDVEARYIKLDVFRSNPSCPLVPKNKKFKVGDDIPVYPCADCKEENICVFFYDYEF